MDDGTRAEAERVRAAYARRVGSGADARWRRDDAANRYYYARREEALLTLLQRHALLPLDSRRIIEIGCGSGGVLREFVRLGARSQHCAGIDLLRNRATAARAAGTGMGIVLGDATALPWRDATFDIALQFTLLSSVLSDTARRAIASETLRVLRPGGVVIIYDFLWNPLNRDTRGVTLRELRALYPDCTIDARRVTLAPPIARLLAPVSTAACRALEAVPLLRSHHMAAVRQPT